VAFLDGHSHIAVLQSVNSVSCYLLDLMLGLLFKVVTSLHTKRVPYDVHLVVFMTAGGAEHMADFIPPRPSLPPS
jgi:hypothetical protein